MGPFFNGLYHGLNSFNTHDAMKVLISRIKFISHTRCDFHSFRYALKGLVLLKDNQKQDSPARGRTCGSASSHDRQQDPGLSRHGTSLLVPLR